jgi:hypothetical protein
MAIGKANPRSKPPHGGFGGSGRHSMTTGYELAEIGTGAVLASYPDVETALAEVTALPPHAKRNAFLRCKPQPECPHCKAPRVAAA